MAASAVAAWRQGFRGIVPDEIDPERAWRPEQIEARLDGAAGDDRTILVAEFEGRVRALAVLGRSRDRDASGVEGEVMALYVHPENWREGLGRALVSAALERFSAEGYQEAVVWTLAESPRNLFFYEALGFRRDGATQQRPSFGGPTEVRFRRSLGGRLPAAQGM